MKYAKKMKLPIIETRICLRCGKEFGITSRQKNKKYCDGCKEIHRIEHIHSAEYVERQKRYMKEYHKNNDSYTPKRHKTNCRRCGIEFISGSGRTEVCINCLRKSDNSRDRRLADYRRDYSEDGERIRISSRYYTPKD